MTILGIKIIKPQNILLFNFYCLITLQLLLNWNLNSCNNHTNLWKLVFMLTLYGRLIGD